MSTPWTVVLVVTWVAMATSLLVVAGFLRRVLPQLERIEQVLATPGRPPPGLPVGSTVPEFVGRAGTGTFVRSRDFAGASWLVVFMSGHCQPCRALAANLDVIRASEARVVVVVDAAEDREALAIPDWVETVVQSDRDIAKAFDSLATPHAFAISSSGVITASAFPKDVAELFDIAATATDTGKEDEAGDMSSAAQKPDRPLVLSTSEHQS